MRIFLEESKPDEVDEDNNYKDEEEEAKKMALQKKSFRFIQNAFERAGVCFYGLQFIKAKIPLLYVYEAINLLINCLEFGNNNVY